VRTQGPDGALQDYKVTHVFGVTPLQQVLLDTGRGRLQALDIAWDSRPRAQGGQRWFALHPDERIGPGDPLHWTGPNLNWNHMCAECHSTNLQKGYDVAADRYHTTWSEVDVACEACHGPGSAHVAWAERAPRDEQLADKGLQVSMPGPGTWVFAPGAVTVRAADVPRGTEVEACGRCHARRAPLTTDYRHGASLHDTHLLSLLEPGLYFADGQIEDEVFEYGSFVQSRMYHAGVTCSECHDPHSLRLRDEGNTLCARCHQPAHFDRREHHHHEPGTPGAGCIDCHMPARTYMVVDPRRDHSLRVPRPDLSVRFGTPNACDECHRDRGASWAADEVARWRTAAGKPLPAHWTPALDAGRRGAPSAPALLAAAADTPGWPAIVRGTALGLLARFDGPQVLAALRAGTADPAPLVRLGAVHGSAELPLPRRAELLLPLLRDPVRAVRQAAGFALAELPPDRLGDADRQALAAAIGDYVAMQQANADRDWAHANLGLLAQRRGDPAAAVAAYQQALRLDPGSVRAAVNLADLHRERGRDDEGERVLRAALARAFDLPPLQHALGLLLVRQDRRDEGVQQLGLAAAGRPEDARFAYTYGVALASSGRASEGLPVLERAHVRHPYDRELLWALATLTREPRDAAAALPWALALLALQPADPATKQLVAELQAGR
jgi:tetratricopeptide (TPR) repeat protein